MYLCSSVKHLFRPNKSAQAFVTVSSVDFELSQHDAVIQAYTQFRKVLIDRPPIIIQLTNVWPASYTVTVVLHTRL
jgi:hypothetical protein